MKTALRIGWILLCLALAFTVRLWNVREVFMDGKIYFVDGDCYSRMTRARLIVEGQGWIIHHHDFENWPQGVTPHTTAPMDWLIVGLKNVLDLGVKVIPAVRTSVLAGQMLDLSGALISLLLGVAGVLSMAVIFWRWRIPYGGVALFFTAVSPVLVHGTLLGRPDHQSLLIFLFTVALGTELILAGPRNPPAENAPPWRRFLHRQGIPLLNGVAWGCGLWVSLYEPLILLGLVAVFRLAFGQREVVGEAGESMNFVSKYLRFVVMVAILVTVFTVEGWRLSLPDAAFREEFARWEKTIGELSHLDLSSPLLGSWLGWGAFLSPVLLAITGRQDRRAWMLLAVLLAVLGLTIWQVRWGYFLAVVFAWSLPWQMMALRRAWVAWPVFLVGLWPVLQDWDNRLAGEEESTLIDMQRREAVALRDLVLVTMREPGQPFLAPWWLSPAIAYWTGQPGVAGTSHESLPGIIDTARFYLSTDPAQAAAILRAHRVRWVLADEPSREINTSAVLLGVSAPANPMATILSEKPDEAPPFMAEWKAPTRPDGLRFYRLYEVDDTAIVKP